MRAACLYWDEPASVVDCRASAAEPFFIHSRSSDYDATVMRKVKQDIRY